MKKKYKQLNQEQRYQIGVLLEAEKNKSKIAHLLGVHKSSISREINRNTGKRGLHAGKYVPRLAQSKTVVRHRAKNKLVKLYRALKATSSKLAPKRTAESRAYRSRIEMHGYRRSYARMYLSMDQGMQKSNRKSDIAYKYIYKFLRNGRRRFKQGNYKNTRGTIKDRVLIEDRPDVVNERTRLGDVEVDLIMGKDHKSALMVMTERSTLVTTLDKLEGKDSKVIQQLISQRIARIGSSWIKTMTFDNGKEFARHKEIADEHGVKTYFTRPYTSQEKGTVVNRIGLIRRFLPKKTDLNLVSDQRIKEIEKLINNRRVRKFGYISPIEKLKTTWQLHL